MRPIRKWDLSLSTGLEAIVTKCTKSDPDERYQSAEELKYALEHYREFETDYQAAKKKSVKMFAAMAGLSLTMLCASLGSNVYASSLKSGTYNEKLRQAEISANDKEKISAYEYANKLDPSRTEAFDSLLTDVFLGEGVFTQEESDALTNILGYKGNGNTKTVEEIFASIEEGYDKFCFDLGLAYFYYYGDTGNKQLSKPWFSIAKDSKTLPAKKAERAKKFYQISDYYTKLGSHNKAGDNAGSYKDYWNDLVMLSAGDIASEDNVKTALVIYKELTYQIGSHALEFKNAGVKRAELEDELQMATDSLNSIVDSSDYNSSDYEEIENQIRSNISFAEQVLETVFAKTSISEEGGTQ